MPRPLSCDEARRITSFVLFFVRGPLLRSRFSRSILRLLLLRLGTLLRSSSGLLLLRLGMLLLLRLGMLLRSSFSLLLRLGMLLLLRLSMLLLRRRFSLLLRLSTLLLRGSFSLLLRLGMLLRRRRFSLLLRLGTLLLSRPGLLLLWRSPSRLLCLLPGRSASRNRWSDRFALRNGLGRGINSRTPVINGGKLLAVLCCRLLVLQLRSHRRNALLTHSGHFRRQRPASDAPRSVVAGAVNCGVVDRAVVHVNVGDVHIVNGAVVVEPIVVPVPALITDAGVAESIVNTAVVADILSPKTIVVAIHAAEKSPVSRRPQEAHLGRLCPNSRHPVVTLRSIAPVSRRPQITLSRARRLRIFREWWRGLLRLQHGLAITRILDDGIVIVIGVGLVG